MLVLALDLVGIVAFAAAGALAGVRARLDVFGVAVLGGVTALGGGMLRDVLLGAHPPVALTDWRYLAPAVLVSLLVVRVHPRMARIRRVIAVLDAFGLGLFATSGAALALQADAGPLAAALIGMVTAVGGGVLRDVLLRQVPVVLRTDVYALAALAGSVVVVAAAASQLPAAVGPVAGVVLATGLRLVALRHRWGVPLPR